MRIHNLGIEVDDALVRRVLHLVSAERRVLVSTDVHGKDERRIHATRNHFILSYS